jgi:transposase-like protein
MVFDPVEGMHYPGSTGDFLAWFTRDVDCLDYLAWLRWPNGFVCPTCESAEGGWRLGDGRFMCADCGARTSVTAGTIFDRTRTPLTVWFHACWMFATQKDGVSALSVQRVLEIGSYQTAWAMLHRLREALVRPGRERLTGEVEMDELFVGGEEPGVRGRQKGKKVLVGCAVERKYPKGFGRIRMAVLPDASTASLAAFLADHVEPGASLITDGWAGYIGAATYDYYHLPIVGDPEQLPGVHRAAALLKRWLLSTHQGSVDPAHLPGYLNEFVFRFNRRDSRRRGLLFLRALELAVAHHPVRYRDLARSTGQPRKRMPEPPKQNGHPSSVERAAANRPWRQPL